MSNSEIPQSGGDNQSMEISCIHVQSPRKAQTVAEAADTFCNCVENHIVRQVVQDIQQAQQLLNKLTARLETIQQKESRVAMLLKNRVSKASSLINKAKAACRKLSEDVATNQSEWSKDE